MIKTCYTTRRYVFQHEKFDKFDKFKNNYETDFSVCYNINIFCIDRNVVFNLISI